MPDTKEDNSKPYVAKTEFALSKVLFEYEFDVFAPEGIVQDPTDEEEYDDFIDMNDNDFKQIRGLNAKEFYQTTL